MAGKKAEELLSTARSIMKEADYCFFMSHGASGEINARLMHPFEPDSQFNVWLGASPSSRKVREILKDNKVTLAFINPRSTAYVTIVGTAALDSNIELKRKYWRAYWTDMYPGGPEADDYILVKIIPYRIELMNFANSALPQPFGLKPSGLTRQDGGWKVIEDGDDL
jgi:general stress protein 26